MSRIRLTVSWMRYADSGSKVCTIDGTHNDVSAIGGLVVDITYFLLRNTSIQILQFVERTVIDAEIIQ